MATASGAERMGHTRANVGASVRSKPSTSGADDTDHAPTCVRSSVADASRSTCSMSGYAQHPGRESGAGSVLAVKADVYWRFHIVE